MSLPFMLEAETVAKAMNISISTLYKLSKADNLPFPTHKLGKLYRYKRTEVEAYLGASLEEVLSPYQTVVMPPVTEDLNQ